MAQKHKESLQKLSDLEQEIKRLQKENNETSNEVSYLTQEIHRLQKENKNFTAQIENLLFQITELSQENKELKEKPNKGNRENLDFSMESNNNKEFLETYEVLDRASKLTKKEEEFKENLERPKIETLQQRDQIIGVVKELEQKYDREINELRSFYDKKVIINYFFKLQIMLFMISNSIIMLLLRLFVLNICPYI